jgi:cyclic nucleotide-binding protein
MVDESRCNQQEEPRVRSRYFPRDHWRAQKDLVGSKKTNHLHTRGRGGLRLLYSKKQGETHGRIQDCREATIAILGEGNFFGEGSLAGQLRRMRSAAALTVCEVLRVDKKAMMEALHREHAFFDMFVAYLLARNIRYEEDLVDQVPKISRRH